jgi:hypothetical protein
LWSAATDANMNFPELTDTQKLCYILSDPVICYQSAKFCDAVILTRYSTLYT